MITFWDVVERTSTGERMKESEFDAMLWQNMRAVLEKYDIHFDGETAVPSDDGLADRAYQAALEFFVANGFYCTSTQRVVRFTREEVEEKVRRAKTKYVFGEGRDQHTMVPRSPESPSPPTCVFSLLGVPVKEDIFPKVCLAVAQEDYSDAFCCVSLHDTFRGIPIKSGHPTEVAACHVGHHQAPRGRSPGGATGAGPLCPRVGGRDTESIIASIHPSFGALPRDATQNGAIAEMKVDYERMSKVAFQRECGFGLAGLYGPLMGGYAGGPEGTMIVQIAHFFLGLMAFDVEYHICFPIDIRETCSTTLSMLWLVSVYCQAIARNSKMLNVCTTMAAAGPGTDMLFYEMAAGAIAHTVSGGNSVQGGIAVTSTRNTSGRWSSDSALRRAMPWPSQE